MLAKNRTRIILSLTSALVLTLSLGRCSPIAPSISKNGFNSGNLPSTSEGPGQAPGSAPNAAKSVQAQATLKGPFATVVSDTPSDTHPLVMNAVDGAALDQTHLEEFKKSGSTDVAIPDELTVREFHVAFKIDMSADAIAAQHLDGFEVRLDRKSSDVWSMRAKTPGPLATIVQDHLTAISITIQPETN